MKKAINHVLVVCLVFTTSLLAQHQSDLNELLDRLTQNHFKSVTDVFTSEEIAMLQAHFSKNDQIPQERSALLRRRGFSTQAVAPVNVVKIDPLDTNVLELLGPSPLSEFEGAGVNITETNTTVIVDNSSRIYIRGINSNNYQYTGMTMVVVAGESITGLERLSDGTIYGIGTNGVDSSHLYRLEENFGTTVIGGNNGLVLPLSLARGPADQLLVLDGDDDNIYGINATNGVVNLIGPAGFDANFGQGMAFDMDVNMVLLSAFNGATFDSELRSLNPNDGSTTLIATITPGMVDQFGFVDWADEDKLEISEVDFENFELFPNPVDEVLHLYAQTAIEYVALYDFSGKLILEADPLLMQWELELSYIQTGIYLLEVQLEGQRKSFKVIKK